MTKIHVPKCLDMVDTLTAHRFFCKTWWAGMWVVEGCCWGPSQVFLGVVSSVRTRRVLTAWIPYSVVRVFTSSWWSLGGRCYRWLQGGA
jgi:hypothetical protein